MRIKQLENKFRSGTITRSQTAALDRLLGQRITEIGMRNNRTDQQRIQEVHDMAVELGAACNGDHVPGVMKQFGMSEAWHGASAKGKRCYQQLIAKGMPKEKAIAICRSSLKEEAEPTQEATPTKYQGIDFTPPEAVQKAAMRGLALRKKHGRGGLTTNQAGEQGIGSGVARATTLASGKAVSPTVINQMVSFFARHEGNKDTPPDKGNGRIAWLLWGGDAAHSWASGIKQRMDVADKKAEAVMRNLEAEQDINEKTSQAIPLLKHYGYSDDEAREICQYAFGKKKPKPPQHSRRFP